jgi:LysM repeat protein
METDENRQSVQQVILLDFSLFILDLLSPQKIKENVLSDNLILEVPGALVSMLWSARADIDSNSNGGKSILFDFIYAHLLGIKKYPINQNTQDQTILEVVAADQLKLHSLANIAYERLFSEFTDIIEGATKTKPHNSESEDKNSSNYLIRRYEPSVSLGIAEEYELQKAYRNNFGLKSHPLYDLYFMQIYHAQTIGLAASPVLKRDLFALGNNTFQSIQEWKKDFYTKWSSPQDTNISSERIKEVSKKVLKGTIRDELIGLTLSAFIPGAGVVLFASKIIPPILDIAEEVTGKPITDTVIIIAIIALAFFCIGTLVISLFKFSQTSPGPSYPSTNIMPTILPLYTPVTTLTIPPITSPTLIPYASATLPITDLTATQIATQIPNPSYCLYVVQTGDTVQNVASWFNISDIDIKNSDKRVNQGTFVLHQLVRIDAPCCTHIGVNNGFSYSVQPKDTVLSLAKNFSISTEKIVSSNNLADSRYIQTGQMLCIPYP